MNLLIKNFPKETQKELRKMAIDKGIPVAQLIISILKEKINAKLIQHFSNRKD